MVSCQAGAEDFELDMKEGFLPDFVDDFLLFFADSFFNVFSLCWQRISC
jgi:hypothetical protein